MRHLKFIFLFVFLYSSLCSVFAQTEPKRGEIFKESKPRTFSKGVPNRIASSIIRLYNNSQYKISFQLGTSLTSLDTFQIGPNEQWVSPRYPPKSRPLIIIKTGETEVNYKLRLNHVYKIYRNEEKMVWDLKKLKNPNKTEF